MWGVRLADQGPDRATGEEGHTQLQLPGHNLVGVRQPAGSSASHQGLSPASEERSRKGGQCVQCGW